MSKYNVIAIVGEAGSGKDHLLKSLQSLPLDFNTIVSHTTRPPREGEYDGINYHFVTPDYFEQNEFIEISSFRDWKYGTALSSLSEDMPNVGVFNPDGVYALAQHPKVNLVVYCLDVPPEIRLIRQMLRVTNPDTVEIVRRYWADIKHFKKFRSKYEYVAKFLDNTEDFDLEVARVEIGKQIRSMITK